MIRVLHIMPSYGGGIGSFIVNIVKSLESSEVVNDIASFTTYPDFYTLEFEKRCGKTITIKQIRLKHILSNIHEIRSVIRNGKYDVVYLHATDVSALWFSTWARSCGVRRIIVHSHQTNHDSNHGLLAKVKFALYRWLTVAVSSQQSSCSKMASEFRFGKSLVCQHKIMHIPNSINIDVYSKDIIPEERNRLRESLGVSADEILIGHVGRFEKQKNHSFMLRLIKYMKDSGIRFKWIFVGIGNCFEQIKKESSHLELGDSVAFLGRRDDMCALFQSMDVSILPSFYEGLPTVAVECQAAGTPMIIADTITNEVDMGLGLISVLSLRDSLSDWTQAIIESSTVVHADATSRIESIVKRRFSSREASKLYEDFIIGKITSYNFEDIG